MLLNCTAKVVSAMATVRRAYVWGRLQHCKRVSTERGRDISEGSFREQTDPESGQSKLILGVGQFLRVHPNQLTGECG